MPKRYRYQVEIEFDVPDEHLPYLEQYEDDGSTNGYGFDILQHWISCYKGEACGKEDHLKVDFTHDEFELIEEDNEPTG